MPGTGVAHGYLHSEDVPLPRSVEHRFVLFDLDFAEAIHTTHVVHAVHRGFIPHAFVGRSAMSALCQEETFREVAVVAGSLTTRWFVALPWHH
jgi:hypothetical protein